MKRLFVLYICCLMILGGCSAPATSSVTPIPIVTPSPTIVPPTPTIEPTPAPTEAPTPTPTIDPNPIPVIPGSNALDITLSLEKKGSIPASESRDLTMANEDPTKGRSYSSSGYDIFGLKVYYHINTNRERLVTVAEFDIDNNGLKDKEFGQCAQGFLGFCATMPYDTAQSEEARKWVEENIPLALKGKIVKKEFGDANYTLTGDKIFLTLRIEALGYEEYANKLLSN